MGRFMIAARFAAASAIAVLHAGSAQSQSVTPVRPPSLSPSPSPSPSPLLQIPSPLPSPTPSPSVIAPHDIVSPVGEPSHRFEDILRLYQIRRFEEASGNGENFLASLNPDVDKATYGAVMGLLGRINHARGWSAEAETQLLRAIEIGDSLDEAQKVNLAGDLDALAQLYLDQGRLDEAELLFKRALAVTEQSSSNKADVGRALNNLAWLYQAQGRFAQAEPVVNRALVLIESSLGSAHADYGRTLDTLAKLSEGLGHVDDAEPRYRKALEILQIALGPDHESVAATCENLGGLLKAQGRYEEAQKFLLKAVAIKEVVLGRDHPRLAPALAQLGDLYRQQGRAQEAERTFGRALTIHKTALREVPVFFATGRKLVERNKVNFFGGERAGSLSFGHAKVFVSKPQTEARISRAGPAAMSIAPADLETTEVSRLAIRNITLVADRAEAFQFAQRRLDAANVYSGQVFVFVHGYNVTFENALRRTAQIAYDLNFDGAPFLFSWPSRGGLLSYGYDRESAEIAVNDLKDFLDQLLLQTNAKKVHLIAHSMGNVVLLNALEKIKLGSGSNPSGRFAEIVLHAPDVDRDRFVQLMKAINGIGRGVTLYASASDKALGVSSLVWGLVGRAGGTPSIVYGVETIDVTAAGGSLLGLNHDLYASNPTVLNDMRLVLESGKRPPETRSSTFVPTVSDAGKYWLYRLPAVSAKQQ